MAADAQSYIDNVCTQAKIAGWAYEGSDSTTDLSVAIERNIIAALKNSADSNMSTAVCLAVAHDYGKSSFNDVIKSIIENWQRMTVNAEIRITGSWSFKNSNR